MSRATTTPTKGRPMSELSREQVEALGACSERWWKQRSGSMTLGEYLAPTVAAMLDQARAEVVADVEAAIGLATERDSHAGVRAVLARHAGADQ